MSVALLQQAINYMEDITYVDAAKSVHMSGYSFHRVFSFTVGMTANEYIRYRRLSLAGQELQNTDISVTEAAYKYGYESPESFSKAFSRFHGSTPRQARRKGSKLRLFDPLVIKIAIGGGSMMEYRIEHKESRLITRCSGAPAPTAGAWARPGTDSLRSSVPRQATPRRTLRTMRSILRMGSRVFSASCGCRW